jgi:hypothetical protein
MNKIKDFLKIALPLVIGGGVGFLGAMWLIRSSPGEFGATAWPAGFLRLAIITRVLYAYNRLYLRDAAETKKALAAFEKACANSPFAGEIPGERELVELVRNKAVL